MRKQKPMTQVMKASEARQQWSQILNRVFRGETRILVEKSDIPVAGIISAEDLQLFNQWEEDRAKRFAVVDEIQEAFSDVSPAEIEQVAMRALTQARKRGPAKPKA